MEVFISGLEDTEAAAAAFFSFSLTISKQLFELSLAWGNGYPSPTHWL